MSLSTLRRAWPMGDVEQQDAQPLGKSVCLGKHKILHTHCVLRSLLNLSASKALCKRRLGKQQSVSHVANTWWIIHSVVVQKGFSLFWVNNYLEGFPPSSALVVAGKLLWSQHVAAASASLLIWVGLGQPLRYTGVQPSSTVSVYSFVSHLCTFSSWLLQNKF